jgi:outer membrane murein-binding lipoprotein Lpp
MNKALHVFVYLFLILAGVSLYLETQLNAKRELLTDRNRLQEDYFIKIAGTIEKEEPPKDLTAEIKKDISPVEAKIIDTPDTENVLEDYKAFLEKDNLPTFEWDKQPIRDQMRAVYVLDAEGKPVLDGNRPRMKGPGTEDELLNSLFVACQNQQAKLNTTRAELRVLHEKLVVVVDELNKLKPIARQDKVTIVERDAKIAKLEAEKTDLENQIVRLKAQVDELNTEIISLKDEVVAAKDETEAAKEELAKSQKLVEQLKKRMQELTNQLLGKEGRGNAVGSVPAGDKGVIITANNKDMFAIVRLTPQAMKELKGNDLTNPIPSLEFGVRRKGFNGTAGEFVGKIRLRQEIAGKNYVICDILGDWKQIGVDLEKDDVIFAD